MMLVPDELCADIYNKQVAPYMTEGKALAFAHGFNIHFKTITAPKNVDVIMIAPKGPGHIVPPPVHRGRGLPQPDLRGAGLHRQGQGHRPGLRFRHRRRPRRHPETTFREETETDLFGEQAVLCGGVCELIHAGFRHPGGGRLRPEMAYFETCHEMKLIVDLINEGASPRCATPSPTPLSTAITAPASA